MALVARPGSGSRDSVLELLDKCLVIKIAVKAVLSLRSRAWLSQPCPKLGISPAALLPLMWMMGGLVPWRSDRALEKVALAGHGCSYAWQDSVDYN